MNIHNYSGVTDMIQTTETSMQQPTYSTVPGRHDLYRAIHRGLRFGHCQVLTRLATTDFTIAEEQASALSAVRRYLDLAQGHMDSEDTKIHPAVAARDPLVLALAEEGHDDHGRAFEALEAQCRRIEDATPDTVATEGERLYHRYARFLADDLHHMEEEETNLLGALQALFSDDELRAIEGSIVTALSWPRLCGYMGLIIAALCHRERVAMLTAMREGMPFEVFGALITEGVRPAVDPDDWARLAGSLGHAKAA